MNQYISPLSKLYSNIRSKRIDTNYAGNLYEILEDLKSPKNIKTRVRNSSRVNVFDINNAFHPPRIIRTLLDFKINSSSELRFECLNTGINSVLEMYQDPQNTPDFCNNLSNYFRLILPKKEFKDLMFQKVYQETDNISFDSSRPELSFNFVKNLEQILTCKDILFIPLGYGGIMPGLDIFNKYTYNNPKSKSVFYPVRFSKYKLEDEVPQLEPKEIIKLETFTKTKQVVIFDEDSCSGLTLDIAKKFFQDNLKQKNILSYANNSMIQKYSLTNSKLLFNKHKKLF